MAGRFVPQRQPLTIILSSLAPRSLSSSGPIIMRYGVRPVTSPKYSQGPLLCVCVCLVSHHRADVYIYIYLFELTEPCRPTELKETPVGKTGESEGGEKVGSHFRTERKVRFRQGNEWEQGWKANHTFSSTFPGFPAAIDPLSKPKVICPSFLMSPSRPLAFKEQGNVHLCGLNDKPVSTPPTADFYEQASLRFFSFSKLITGSYLHHSAHHTHHPTPPDSNCLCSGYR